MEQHEITGLAAFLRPFLLLVLMIAIVYPLTMVARRYLPDGRVKAFLFRERTRPEATWKDKAIMTAAVIAFYVVFFAWVIITDRS